MSEQNIQVLALEDVMGDRFGRYSKYIIQDRALPDIRDGLKPVQRRILYAMHVDGNTSDKNFRKSAKTVGNVIANYHPHGDTSVYDAMVRLSQDWKQREVLVEMHGNNGSMDGDSAAAMRYTEARLAKISDTLLADIDKETVDFILNFDDTSEEPIVLPARYPNLLINGATGISAGYATDIPPHNIAEVIDATIHLIAHPKATTADLMAFVQGPDFPTGAIIQGADGLREAYETGKGKVVVRSKTAIETIRGGKQQIVITEIPYDVNKATLVKRMDEIRIHRKIDGIAEVRDESDRTGLQIVVELKKDANANGVLNYLLKHTDLQVSYNFNMVAIHERRPVQVGLVAMLSAYVSHQRDVITRRTRFDLKKAQARLHIVDGLMRALSILDEVIQLIRASQDKKQAKENLMATYQFSEIQAEAIVSLQLYRLTNTDITALQNEKLDLNEQIASFELVLKNDQALRKLMTNELKEIKKQFATPRRTLIQENVEAITIEKEWLIPEEDVMVVISQGGYIKRVSMRSFGASNQEPTGLREGDNVLYAQAMSTLQHIVVLTSKGNYIHLPVHELSDAKWKDIGAHLSQTHALASDERLLTAFPAVAEADQSQLVCVTKEGMIKQVLLSDLQTYRSYKSKTNTAMSLKTDTDEVIAASIVDSSSADSEIVLVTHLGFGLRYSLSEVPVVGLRASGVKAINLKANDYVVGMGMFQTNDERKQQLLLVTQRGTGKRLAIEEINRLGRAKRGLMLLKELKTNPYRFVFATAVQQLDDYIIYQTSQNIQERVQVRQLPILDRYSNGSSFMNEKTAGEVITVSIEYATSM